MRGGGGGEAAWRRETWGLQAALPPHWSLSLLPIPYYGSFGDVLPLNQATVLLGRAAGWRRGQVDVFPSWVGKLEKYEMDTCMFIYSSYCLFPSPGPDSRRGQMGAFSARRSGAGCKQLGVKRKRSFELKTAPVFRSPQATCCWFDQ